jgi:hypothetical protein
MYDDAVGKCRVALEPFAVSVEEDDSKGGKKKVPKLSKCRIKTAHNPRTVVLDLVLRQR